MKVNKKCVSEILICLWYSDTHFVWYGIVDIEVGLHLGDRLYVEAFCQSAGTCFFVK